MQTLQSLIATLLLTLCACSAANVGGHADALGGHSAVVDADTLSVSLTVQPSLTDSLQAQTEVRSLDSVIRLEVIRPEGCAVHEATVSSLREGQSALRDAFLELDSTVREALLQDLPEHRAELSDLDADAR